ncbi:MAG: restriction endonuclease subunit S [Bacilli bacterium]|nr:restriction endonuclease subunit S [Bacilli bacterium]
MRFSDDAWQIAKIGDVLTIERGGSPRPIQNFVTRRLDGINWIKIGDTSDDGYIYSAKEKIIPEGAKRSRKVKAGDLLLSNSMSFGKPYILKIDGCIHDGWLVIRDIDSKFNKEFLRNYLGSSFCISQYKKLAAGGVVTNLNKDLVCSAIIKYPPIASQEKIASFLCILDEKIRTQNKIIKELETYKSAIENMIFKSINFPLFAIGDLCKITTGKLDANATVSGGMYRFYTCAANYTYIDKYAFDCDAVLISGNGANVGYVHQYNGKFNAYQRTYVLYDFANITSTYLRFFLEKYLKQRINSEKNNGNTPYIRLETISKMKIGVPDQNKQNLIVNALLAITSKIDNEQKLLENFYNQKRFLLANLFI